MTPASSFKPALGLALGLWGIILFINWLGPGEVFVSLSQIESIEKNGDIDRVVLYPYKIVIHLKQPLQIQTDGGSVYTDEVYALRDSLSLGFEARSTELKLLREELVHSKSLVGEFTILFFITIGIAYLGFQIYQDRRHGSARRQIADLDAAYRAGKIEEGPYRKQLEDLLAKL